MSRHVDQSSRAATTLLAAAGILVSAYGLWALLAIPRGPHEFSYQNMAGGTAFWPLPFAPLNGFTPEQLSSHVARALFLLPGCVLLAAALRPVLSTYPFSVRCAWSVLAGVVITASIAALVLRGVPLQDDEATYLMQAELFTRGLVADPTHPASQAFDEPFTIFTQAGMSGMYLFGTPLVLAPGLLVGAPWLGQAALAAITLWSVYRAAATTGDRTIASVGTALLAVSPMFTFTSATSLSEVPALAGVALAVLGWSIGGRVGAAIAGTGLGFAMAARPQTAVPAAIALSIWSRARDRRFLTTAMLAAVPWLLGIAWYNNAAVGTPWQLPRSAYTGQLEHYGFGQVLDGYTHTPAKALALAGVVAVRLNGWALGWPVSLAGPLLWVASGRLYLAVVGPWAAIAAATFLFQAAYPSVGTSETGALYHYAALPFIVFATAAVLVDATQRRAGWVRSFAVVSLLIGTTTFYAEHAWRLSRLATAIEGPHRGLRFEQPALMIEDVWVSRPQVGWVFGIPFRERSPSASIVRYPRPRTTEEVAFLTARWSGRSCHYLSYDWTSGQYRVDPCSEMRVRDHWQSIAREGGVEIEPGRRADGQPWFQDDGWREAFPYLFTVPRLRW